MNAVDVLEIQKIVRQVPVSDHVIDYALALVRQTRVNEPGTPEFVNEWLSWGAGPRAVQNLLLGGKTRALLNGHTHVSTEDISALAAPVLRHRIVTNFSAESEGITSDRVIERLIEETPSKEGERPVTQDYRKFLLPEAISRISRLEIRARTIVEGFLSGLHRSPFFGQSVEFAQHREYAPGDDVRNIDWKVWSKTDKYYIKQYEEDTNLQTTLLVDVSESMQFGTGPLSKYEYGCTAAAALAFLLLKQQDAVGMVTFDDGIRNRVPALSKRNHLNALLTALASEKPAKKTDIYDVLKEVAETRSQKGTIILISDLFVDRESLFKGLRLLQYRGHDLMLLHILDDQELDFDYSGTTRFEGMEEAGELVCDPRSLRDGYLKAMHEFLNEIRRRCAKNKFDYQTIRTSEYLDAALAHYLNHRIGMQQSIRQ